MDHPTMHESVHTLYTTMVAYINAFMRARRGKPAQGREFDAFMIEADRLHQIWRCAEAKVSFSQNYAPIESDDIVQGLTPSGHRVITVATPRVHPAVPRLELATHNGPWAADDHIGSFSGMQIAL